MATKNNLEASDIPSISKNKISDFPSSMPASDVSAWAKASTKPSYTLDEVSDGTNKKWSDKISKTIETTWASLKSLRDNSQLIPGQWYRITDYTCTTTQENTQSAGHQFDIIVRADSTNTLNENAYAAHHAGDTYFANSKLEAWRLLYCLDNIAWSLKPSHTCTVTLSGGQLCQNVKYLGTEVVSGTTYHKWDFRAYGQYIYSSYVYTENIANGDAYANSMGSWRKVGTVSNIVSSTEEGKGTITWMKDEFDNELSYDFKNIQFKRFYTTDARSRDKLNNCYMVAITNSLPTGLTVSDSGNFIWAYTFSSNSSGGTQTDTSLGGTVKNNVIGDYGDSLPNNVFYGTNVYGNTLGNNVYNNSIGNNFYLNSIGNNFNKNSIGNDFQYNSIGNDCYNSSIGNQCYNNSIGNYFQYNSIGNDVYNNSIGNSFRNNTIGNNMYNNSIGNNMRNNTIGNVFQNNSIGNGCNNIKIQKDYVYFIIIENGNQYINITSTQTTSSSQVLRNFTVAQGVNNSNSTKTISHNTTNDTFKTVYKPANSVEVSV